MYNTLKKWLVRTVMGTAALLVIGMITTSLSFSPSTHKETSLIKQNKTAHLVTLPLYFESNEGQTDASVKYLTRGPGYTFYFTPQEIVMVLKRGLQDQALASSTVLKIQFLDANPTPLVEGIEAQSCKSHYFIGNDPKQWRTNISNYTKVSYSNIYPGIDAIFYGNPQQLEYDICVAPGCDPQKARLHIEGAQELSVDPDGNLHILTADAQDVQMQKPFVYQMIKDRQVIVDGNFVVLAQNEVGFSLGIYDKSQSLVIDPILLYSTYLGGSNTDIAHAIAVDSSGNAYVTGQTASLNFPVTAGAFQPTLGTGATFNAFVTKLNPAGTALVYSTYIGGNDLNQGLGIAIDKSGNSYITGQTSSTNFPVTPGAFQPIASTFGDAFVTKLNPTGSALIYSTYLGGTANDQGFGITVDSNEHAYVTGLTFSSDFPTTPGAFQPNRAAPPDAFITKFNPTGSALVYSSYLGGNGSDQGFGIAINSKEEAFITGFTISTNFPVTAGAFRTTPPGSTNAFVTKFNHDGTSLIYSTYLGGSSIDQGLDITVDSNDHAYVTGFTSSLNFPITASAFQKNLAGSYDVFVTKLNPEGSDLNYSTYLGGGGSDLGNGIAIDSSRNIYVTGSTTSALFPVTANAYQPALAGSQNAFLVKINPENSGTASLAFSTFFGGSGSDRGNGVAVDSNGNAYIAGQTISPDFPVTAGAFQPVFGGVQDAFIAKFLIGNPTVTGISPNVGPATGGTIVVITGTNFTNTTAVNFGTTPATFVIDSDTQITAVAPAGTGTVDVTVTTSIGTSALSEADHFRYEQISSTTLTVVPNPSEFGQPVNLTATITPAHATGTVTFFDGATAIGTSPLASDGKAKITISSFTVGSHSITATYNGDATISGSTSAAVILIVTPVSTVILPPTHLKGIQKENRFATQTDYINILTFQAPSSGEPPVAYQIYRHANLTKRIGEVSAQGPLRFKDHNRKKGKTYTYYIVSVDQFGNLSAPAEVTIKGNH